MFEYELLELNLTLEELDQITGTSAWLIKYYKSHNKPDVSPS